MGKWSENTSYQKDTMNDEQACENCSTSVIIRDLQNKQQWDTTTYHLEMLKY